MTQILTGTQRPEGPVAVTVGSFDGVHTGHRFLFDLLETEARARGLESLVFTFDPHPLQVIGPEQAPPLLTTRTEKEFLLKQTAVDYVYFQTFDKAFAALTGKDFLQWLSKEFGMKFLLLGHDHRFGSDRMSSRDEIRALGQKLGFDVGTAGVMEIDGQAVNSTRIRRLLSEGQIRAANRLLGYNYLLSGTVVHGSRFGRRIGYPTANIRPEDAAKLIPPDGVYAVRSLIEGRWTAGVMNIGTRPTVDGRQHQIEIHFPDYQGDLYDRFLFTQVVDFIRPEQKFDGPEKLARQIKRDIERMREVLAES